MENDPAAGSGDPDSTSGSGDPDAGVDPAEVDARVDDLERSIATLDDEVEELIRDVRERVIQVKREADGKAAGDHEHPDLSADVERLGVHLTALANDFVDVDSSIDALDERIDAVDERTRAGFSNFETVLEYLIETADELNEKLGRVAAATLDVRERAAQLSAAEARRTAADELRESANQHGIAEAKCEDCGGTVDLRLLAAPDCPHCAAGFAELEPRRGLFRSSVLHTGEPPALEGEVAGESTDLASIVADDGPTPPPVDVDRNEPDGDEPDGRSASAPDGPDEKGEDRGERLSGGAETADPAAADPAERVVETVSGVGPTYADQLRAAGVETAGDLALADPDRIARESEIDPGRVEILVRRARDAVDVE